MKTNNIILNGFDRSGTSAISRTLAMHPNIELVFRPFNSGPIRKKMYEILDYTKVTDDDILFFKNLENNKLYSKYIVSEWHNKYSTINDEFLDEKLHVIITNINHFTVKWVSNAFPKIEQWAIWREPKDILNSCIKNHFYGSWYEDSLVTVINTIKQDPLLFEEFNWSIELIKESNEIIKTAFLIAVRNFYLFSFIENGKLIDYDIFKKDPNIALSRILNYFNLNDSFDFYDCLNIDFNSVPSIDGYKRGKSSSISLEKEQLFIVNQLFEPLYRIKNKKKNFLP